MGSRPLHEVHDYADQFRSFVRLEESAKSDIRGLKLLVSENRCYKGGPRLTIYRRTNSLEAPMMVLAIPESSRPSDLEKNE